MQIRQVRPEELTALEDIEVAAGRCFAEIGMPEIAEDAPPTLDTLAEFARHGRAHVMADRLDRPVAYLLDEPVDEYWHIEQVSVHPDHAGHGLGRQLLDHLAERARAADVTALSLTTFSQVSWNAPYYRRLGFETLPENELGPGLRAIRETERAGGYDRWPRECMRRRL